MTTTRPGAWAISSRRVSATSVSDGLTPVAQDVGRVADERQHALVADLAQRALVGRRADRRASRRSSSRRCAPRCRAACGSPGPCSRGSNAPSGRTRPRRAPSSSRSARLHDRRSGSSARPARSRRFTSSRPAANRVAIDAAAEPRPEVRHGADMVLVGVGDDQAEQVAPDRLDEARCPGRPDRCRAGPGPRRTGRNPPSAICAGAAARTRRARHSSRSRQDRRSAQKTRSVSRHPTLSSTLSADWRGRFARSRKHRPPRRSRGPSAVRSRSRPPSSMPSKVAGQIAPPASSTVNGVPTGRLCRATRRGPRRSSVRRPRVARAFEPCCRESASSSIVPARRAGRKPPTDPSSGKASLRGGDMQLTPQPITQAEPPSRRACPLDQDAGQLGAVMQQVVGPFDAQAARLGRSTARTASASATPATKPSCGSERRSAAGSISSRLA